MTKTYIAAAIALAAGVLTSGHAWAADKKAPAKAVGPAIDEQTIHYESLAANIDAYHFKPQGGGKHPAIVLVHDNFGLTDSTKAIARSLAQAGYVVVVPDLLSRLGGQKPSKNPSGPVAMLNVAKTVSDVDAAYDMLANDANVDATKISAIGMGWGAWRAYKLAEDKPALYRVVTYYGITPDDEEIKQVKAPILAHYAQGDFLTTASALKSAKWIPKFTYYIYPNTYRGFAGGGAGGIDMAAAVGEAGEIVAASDASKAEAAKTVDDSALAAKQAMERSLAFLK